MNIVQRYPLVAVAAALALGVLIGRSSLFGYSSAQECAIHAQTRIGAGACYDLYPHAPSAR